MGLGGGCPVLLGITSRTGSGFLGGGGTYTFVPRKRALRIVGLFMDIPRSAELYSASFWRCLDRRRSWLCAIGPCRSNEEGRSSSSRRGAGTASKAARMRSVAIKRTIGVMWWESVCMQ